MPKDISNRQVRRITNQFAPYLLTLFEDDEILDVDVNGNANVGYFTEPNQNGDSHVQEPEINGNLTFFTARDSTEQNNNGDAPNQEPKENENLCFSNKDLEELGTGLYEFLNNEEFTNYIQELEELLELEAEKDENYWFDAQEEIDFSDDEEEYEDIDDYDDLLDSDSNASKSHERLADWLVNCRVPQGDGNLLLKILKEDYEIANLPECVKTLLKTPKSKIFSSKIRKVEPGEYLHFGLKDQLEKHIPTLKLPDNNIQLQINIDGLPITNSSAKCLWPILGNICGTDTVFVIGIYAGLEKPKDSNEFLKEFIDEVASLTKDGILMGGKQFVPEIKAFVLDAPAKSFTLKIKGHTGYHSCSKCDVAGYNNDHRTYFPEKGKPRTNEAFNEFSDDYFHMGKTDLVNIKNIKLVTNTVIDYLHALCLGIMKKLILLWIAGKIFRCKLQCRDIEKISYYLENVIKKALPKEFKRKCRSLKYVKYFKGVEFRQILFYTGAVIFKNILKDDIYEHFLVLHTGCRILSMENSSNEDINYAEKLFEYFVPTFGQLYRIEHISHNVHTLYHLPEDVRNHGNMDKFSAFKFENYLFQMKNLIRKGDKPLQQLFNRYYEKDHCTIKNKNSSENKSSAGKIIINNCEMIPGDNVNNCWLTDSGEVILVDEILGNQIVGRSFKSVKSLFVLGDFPSEKIGEFLVEDPSVKKTWLIGQMKKKCLLIPLENKFAALTLLHTEN